MLKNMVFRSENSFSQQCYDQLYEEIITGVLKPGEKLKVQELKDRFGIGQSPIREALSRLVACDLVETQENRGFWVASISESIVRDTFGAFTLIENMLIRLAMQKGDAQWGAGIVSELYRLGQLEQSGMRVPFKEWEAHNYAFHVALIAGCGSSLLLEIRRMLYVKFLRYCRLSYETDTQTLVENYKEHAALAEAVLARDVKKAETIMTRHLSEAFEDVIDNLKMNGMV